MAEILDPLGDDVDDGVPALDVAADEHGGGEATGAKVDEFDHSGMSHPFNVTSDRGNHRLSRRAACAGHHDHRPAAADGRHHHHGYRCSSG